MAARAQASTSDSVDDRDWTARKAQFPTPPPNVGGRAGGQPVSKQQVGFAGVEREMPFRLGAIQAKCGPFGQASQLSKWHA